LRRITGQQPVKTVAKKSIAGFKLREKNAIGAMVTLRGERMYEFLDRLVNVVLPRIRDFRGISPAAFDPQGNYSLGLSDHTIFPEINLDEAGNPFNLQVNIVIKAEKPEDAKALLEKMNFPLRSEK
jgi:large subunit ribosomal protein L5